MWFIGAKVEQETSATPPKKNPGSARWGNQFSNSEPLFTDQNKKNLVSQGVS